jgi:hypothetical protein
MRIPWTLGVVLGLGVWGCGGDSSCSGDNGMACDFLPTPVVIQQDSVRLHFASIEVTEGTCAPPRCIDRDCTALLFEGAALPSVPDLPPDAPIPEAHCRFDVASAEGESLDVVVTLAGSKTITECCCTWHGPQYGGCYAAIRYYVFYSWSVSVNGIDLGRNGVHLPPVWDGGIASIDAAIP